MPLPHTPAATSGRGGRSRRERPHGRHPHVHPGLNCGHCPACLDGQDSLCATSAPSVSERGRRAGAAPCPRATSPRYLLRSPSPRCAASSLTFLTAWHMVSRAVSKGGDGAGDGGRERPDRPRSRWSACTARGSRPPAKGEVGAAAGAGRRRGGYVAARLVRGPPPHEQTRRRCRHRTCRGRWDRP